MIGLTVVVSVFLAAPPTTPLPKAATAQVSAPIKGVATFKPKTATVLSRKYAPVDSKTIRTAQVPPKTELPPQPQALTAPPLPLETVPGAADPYEAPRLPVAVAPVPPPPAIDEGASYGGPVVAQPMEMPPTPSFTEATGPADWVGSAELGAGCPNCYGCPCDDDDDGCCLCGPDSPCDLYPHYAYYPQHHGHYYFRPYNYQTIFEHQQWATCAGLDPRNPYSNKIFCMALAGFEQVYRPENAPIGSALPNGNGLPQLEELLPPKTLP